MPDNIFGALELTVLNMLVIFLVLAALAVFITLVRNLIEFSNRDKKKQSTDEAIQVEPEESLLSDSMDEGQVAQPVRIPTVPAATEMSNEGLNPTVVAVLTAAITSYMGQDAKAFAVKSITAIDGVTTDAWLLTGRQRLMQLRNMPAKRR